MAAKKEERVLDKAVASWRLLGEDEGGVVRVGGWAAGKIEKGL